MSSSRLNTSYALPVELMFPVTGNVSVLVTRLMMCASRSGPSRSSTSRTPCPNQLRQPPPIGVSRSVLDAFTSDQPHCPLAEEPLRPHREDDEQKAEDHYVRVLR